MFEFIKNLFKTSEPNVLISRQVISLEDNKFDDGSVFFSSEGDCVRRVKSTDELMEKYGFLIELIKNRALSSDSFIDYDLEILPVIRRFISIVNVAPSDHTLSNVFSSELIRQALLGILRFSDIYNKSSLAVSTGSQNFFESFYLMLTLCLYRFYNRFRITTPGGNYEFRLFRHDSLEEFIRIHRATHLRFYQRKAFDPEITFDNCFMHLAAKCIRTHECLKRSPEYLKIRSLTTTLSFSRDELRFNSPDRKPEIDNLFLMENSLKKMLLKADEISSYLCAHDGGFVLDLGLYLRRFLSSGIISDKTQGTFVLKNGFVIEEGSTAHYLIYKAVERYYTDLNFFADFNENPQNFDLKNEFSAQNDENFSQITQDDRKKNFYELILNSEYLFSNLYKKKSRWLSLLKGRKTYLVKGFEIYFENNVKKLTSEPYMVVELRSMADPGPLLKTLRCTTLRSYDPTYIEFKPMKGPLHFCFLGEPLDTLVEFDRIRFSVKPDEKAPMVRRASDEEIDEYLLDRDSTMADSAEEESVSVKTENNSKRVKTSSADNGRAADEVRSSGTRIVSVRTSSSSGRSVTSRSKKTNADSAEESASNEVISDKTASPLSQTEPSSSSMSTEELCELEKALISNFNNEHKLETEAQKVSDDKASAVKSRRRSA